MKPTFIIIIGLLFWTITSYEDSREKENHSSYGQIENQIHQIKDGDFEFLIIDECEYLVYKEHLLSSQGFG